MAHHHQRTARPSPAVCDFRGEAGERAKARTILVVLARVPPAASSHLQGEGFTMSKRRWFRVIALTALVGSVGTTVAQAAPSSSGTVKAAQAATPFDNPN